MSGVIDSIFGNSEKPGVMGTGQYKAPGYNINQQAFMNPVGDQSQNWNAGMQGMLGATTGHAPSANNVQLGQATTYSGAQMAPTALAGAASVGPTATYGGSTLNGGQYNNTFAQQQALANQLTAQSQGQGPSLAQITADQQRNQNIQQAAAILGSQRGSSNPALAQRALMDAQANAGQQAAQQAVLGRTQEQLAAQAALGGQLGTMNTQAQNFASANAQLQQQAQLASMGALNSQQLAQAQLGQQNQQFNAGALNAQQLAQAQLLQQAGLANQSDINQFLLQQGAMNQQTNMGNLSAQQQQNQLNAQQYNAYMQALQQQMLAQYQGQMGGQQLAVQNQNAINNLNYQGYNASGQAQSGALGGVLGAVGGGLMMSDKNAKINISDASEDIEDMLAFLTMITGK